MLEITIFLIFLALYIWFCIKLAEFLGKIRDKNDDTDSIVKDIQTDERFNNK